MQQPGLAQLLTEGRVLVKCCDEKCRSGNSEEQVEDVDGNPFSFTPQLFHLHKDHEMFEDGDVCRHMYLQDLYISETDDKPILSVSEFACHISGCSAVFSTLEEYEHHYNSLHRHVCCSCRRSFPSARLLDIHIQEWHDSLFTILAERQDMYQCLVEGCGQRFRTSKHRKDHLIRVHKYPPDFRFDKGKKDKGTRGQKEAAVEMVEDVCESEGVCEVMSDVLSSENEHVESMETHACEEARGAPSADEAHIDASAAEPPKHRHTYRVPASVCFGHGSVRGFRGRRGKRK